MSSVVYLIEAVGFDLVKIGFTKDLETRISDLRFYVPFELRVVKTLPGGRREEHALHQRFAEYRHHGEWFRYTPIRSAVQELDGSTPMLSKRIACVDCGSIRSQNSRERSKRCRKCAAKLRTTPAPKCIAGCGATLSKLARHKAGSRWTGMCRACAMRKAWSSDSYQASIMPARAREGVRRRKKCERCDGQLGPKANRFHASCWAQMSTAEKKSATSNQRGITREDSDETRMVSGSIHFSM